MGLTNLAEVLELKPQASAVSPKGEGDVVTGRMGAQLFFQNNKTGGRLT